MTVSDRRAVLLIVATGLVLGLSFQGSRGLYETTEGRYAEVSREMLESGSWMRPTLDHAPHWTKPPLTYWAVAGGLAVAGRNAWGARLPNALALPLTALGVACLGWLLWGAPEGRLAGVVYASSVFPVVAASTISTDLLLSMWEVWAVAAWWGAVRAGPGPARRRRLVAFWVLLGLAFLTKGPPALLLLLPMALWSGVARHRGARPVPVWSTAGFLAFVVVGLSWYLWAVATTPGLLGYFLGDEVVARVATDRFGRNPQWWAPPLVYGPPLALGLGAWLAWRPRRAARAFREELRRGSPELLFLVAWLALPLLVLSVSRSRLPLYVLPIFPAIVLALARAQVRVGLPSGRIRDSAGTWLSANVVLLLLLKAGSAFVSSPRDMAPLAAAVRSAQPDRVVLLDTGVLYGLQFYLDVPVERVAGDPAAAATLRGELARGGSAGAGSAGARRDLTLVVERGKGDGVLPVDVVPNRCERSRVDLVPGYAGIAVRCPPALATRSSAARPAVEELAGSGGPGAP